MIRIGEYFVPATTVRAISTIGIRRMNDRNNWERVWESKVYSSMYWVLAENLLKMPEIIMTFRNSLLRQFEYHIGELLENQAFVSIGEHLL